MITRQVNRRRANTLIRDSRPSSDDERPENQSTQVQVEVHEVPRTQRRVGSKVRADSLATGLNGCNNSGIMNSVPGRVVITKSGRKAPGRMVITQSGRNKGGTSTRGPERDTREESPFMQPRWTGDDLRDGNLPLDAEGIELNNNRRGASDIENNRQRPADRGTADEIARKAEGTTSQTRAPANDEDGIEIENIEDVDETVLPIPTKRMRPIEPNDQLSSVDKLTELVSQQGELIRTLIENQSQPNQSEPRTTPSHQTMKVESVPEYDPSARKFTTTQWIQSIEQFKSMFGWTEATTIYHMQARLRGVARDWYDGLENYKLSWEEWKEALQSTFPEPRDHAIMVDKMKARIKLNNETYESYYFAKMALLRPCHLSQLQQVDHVIDGISDRVVRGTAKAAGYQSPSELYTRGMLPFSQEDSRREERSGTKCGRCGKPGHWARQCRQQSKDKDNTKYGSASIRNKPYDRQGSDRWKSNNSSRDENESASSKEKSGKDGKQQKCTKCGLKGHIAENCRRKETFKCFNCNDPGHSARNCPKEKKQCTKCNKLGHVAENCLSVKIVRTSDTKN